ncbi:hypothetical protein BJY00DRAFT_289861 [Aspergillus carlsbadensis]|nr:hypothetical protein BJY00DRAFT_289861 [Aspergillus carlsbadensis]
MSFPFQRTPFSPFLGRRSGVYSTGGMIACSQPLAGTAGQTILAKGGNAAVSTLMPSISLYRAADGSV